MIVTLLIIFGALTSLLYALLALGFTLIYGVSGVINLAYGALVMVGAYIFGVLSDFFPSLFPAEFSYIALILAFVVTAMLTGIIGSIFYRLTLHGILGDQIATLVVSISGCIVFQYLVFFYFGPIAATRYPVKIISGSFILAGVSVPNAQALGAVVSILLFAILWIFISKSRSGMAMRALSQDIEAAMLMGINVERMYVLVSAISGVIGSIAGVFFTTTLGNGASIDIWMYTLAISFSIVILGGLGSIKGTVIGALIFGYSVTAISVYGQGGLTTAFPFVLLIIVLVIRPKGLFGKHTEME